MRVFKLALGSFLLVTPIVVATVVPHGGLWTTLAVLGGVVVTGAVIVAGTWLIVSEIS